MFHCFAKALMTLIISLHFKDFNLRPCVPLTQLLELRITQFDLNKSGYWLNNSRVIYTSFVKNNKFFDNTSKFFDKNNEYLDKNDI